MAFTENQALFFEDFGETVTVAGTSGVGIFDNASRVVLDGMVATAGPTLTIRQSGFPTVLRDAAVAVRGVNYTVRDVEADGTGIATLMLEKA